MIKLARKGYREPLAELLCEYTRDGSLPPELCKYLVSILPHKQRNAQWREEAVAFTVYAYMALLGKRRDRALRTYLTRKCCEFYGTEPNRVTNYLKTRRSRRR